MDISKQMIGFHLRIVTLAYFGEHDDVPDDVAGYYEYVEDMKRQAIRFGDLDALKLAFEHILVNPEIDTVTLSQANFPYEEEEVREIIRYAWETIWPDADPIPPGGPPGVRIVDISPEEWRARQADKTFT